MGLEGGDDEDDGSGLEDDLYLESEEEVFSDAAESLAPAGSGAVSDAELPLSHPLLQGQRSS